MLHPLGVVHFTPEGAYRQHSIKHVWAVCDSAGQSAAPVGRSVSSIVHGLIRSRSVGSIVHGFSRRRSIGYRSIVTAFEVDNSFAIAKWVSLLEILDKERLAAQVNVAIAFVMLKSGAYIVAKRYGKVVFDLGYGFASAVDKAPAVGRLVGFVVDLVIADCCQSLRVIACSVVSARLDLTFAVDKRVAPFASTPGKATFLKL